MSIETVRFSSHQHECTLIQDALKNEFPNTPVQSVQMHIISQEQGNIVIAINDPSVNIFPTQLVVPIRLDTEITISDIIRKAREWYEAVITPFVHLSVNLSNPSRPQWSNKPQP